MAASELPDALDEWLQQRADELGIPPSELLAELVGAYRVAIEDDDVDAAVLADAMGLDDRIDAQQKSLRRDVERKLADLEKRNKEAIEDVRKRVLQLKRTTESKADVDHTHEELDASIEELGEAVADLETTVEDHEDTIETLDADLDDVQGKLTQVARAVVKLRSEVADGAAADDDLETIRNKAASLDASRATCEGCGEGVEISLLEKPACPHCGADLGDLREASGFFGTPRLTGGTGSEDETEDV